MGPFTASCLSLSGTHCYRKRDHARARLCLRSSVRRARIRRCRRDDERHVISPRLRLTSASPPPRQESDVRERARER